MLKLTSKLVGFFFNLKPVKGAPSVRRARNDPGQPRTTPDGNQVILPTSENQNGLRKQRDQ
jgi:hypothetical protein